jgi:hypothetical protein
MNILGLHSKPEAAVHPGQSNADGSEEEEAVVVVVICQVCTNNVLCLEHSAHYITGINTDFYCTSLFTNPK